MLIETKSNSNHSYYQYIHPCNLSKAKYDYRFLGIVIDGKIINSEPYSDIKECHEALRRLIERDEDTTSTPVKRKRKTT